MAIETPARPLKPESLADFLIARGGVQDQTGDLAASGADTIHHQKGGRLVNPRGMTPDYAREAAEQEGFLRPNSTINDLYDAINEHVSGRPVYRQHEQALGDLIVRQSHESQRSEDAAYRARDAAAVAVDRLGIRIRPHELDHAAQLVLAGAHPEDAVREAIAPGEYAALDRNAQASAFTAPGVPAGATEAPLGLSGGAGGRPLRPMTADQLAAHRDYLAAAQALKRTFDSGAVGDVLAFGEHPTAAQVPPEISRARGGFQYSDAEAVSKILRKGVTEAEATRQALDAGIKPETLTAALADELRARAVGLDGTFDLKEFAKFRREHAGALHVFPDTRAAFDGAARAQQTLETAQAAQRAVAEAHPLRGFAPSQVMARYWKAGDEGAEAVRQFRRDTGGDRDAQAALDSYAIYRLRHDGVVNRDGTIDAGNLDTYTNRYSRALAERPDLARRLSSVRAAQQALDDATAAHVEAMRAYQNGVARNFLHDEPAAAVRKAFAAGPEAVLRLVDAVHRDPDALAGLKSAVAQHILDRFTSESRADLETAENPNAAGVQALSKAEAFRKWVRQNRTPLRRLFGGQGMQNIEMVGADLRRRAQRSVAVPGSPTATYAAAVKRHAVLPEGTAGHVAGGVGLSVLTLLGERLGEVAGEHQILGAVGAPVLGIALHSLRQAGVRTLNDLERMAMLHPDVARALVARVNPDGTVGRLVQRRVGAAVQAAIGADLMNSQRPGNGQ